MMFACGTGGACESRLLCQPSQGGMHPTFITFFKSQPPPPPPPPPSELVVLDGAESCLLLILNNR